MDVRTSIKGRLPHRHLTAVGSTDAALHIATTGPDGSIKSNAPQTIFKKTPDIADLKPGGRDVAKDMREIGNMPFLLQMRLEIDDDIRTLDVKLTEAGRAERKTKWKPGATHHTSGAVGNYAQQIGPAVDGAVTHPGGAHEKQCYADI